MLKVTKISISNCDINVEDIEATKNLKEQLANSLAVEVKNIHFVYEETED